MYNRNYGGRDYDRIYSEMQTSVLKKINNFKPVTDGYTKPLEAITYLRNNVCIK